ncbi:hypothetical protein BDF21DRAFT_428919 [Thamnidium elegans]|uniref:Uncharacterized protein n=1 Tax=Thamnidium elegans TaxID=101142 RepID=A0A8H7VXS8_9FUNG|nr:hypothetical protein INT48_004946 [Thamnidium elegans]KAI8061990.1 hypothetical protein BDF21DRAFT_428919 [Thamnidium elegans]
MLTEQDNLKSWPSDVPTSKFNVFEFYHKILWASQQCEEQVVPIKKKGCRVTFSLEPPMIHEYEPEFINTNKTCIFDYQSFKRKFHQAKEQEKYFYPTIEDDEMYYQNRRLMKTRSLSDFKPIPNQMYHANNNNSTELTRSSYSLYDIPHYDDDPPPSYIEYRNDQDENRYKNTNLLGGNMKIKKAEFFKRTLRKIKSSPRLIQRKSSMISLRKKKSFFSLGA